MGTPALTKQVYYGICVTADASSSVPPFITLCLSPIFLFMPCPPLPTLFHLPEPCSSRKTFPGRLSAHQVGSGGSSSVVPGGHPKITHRETICGAYVIVFAIHRVPLTFESWEKCCNIYSLDQRSPEMHDGAYVLVRSTIES